MKGNPRDMSQYKEQAAASRKAKQEAAKNLKQDFNSADVSAWKELASKHGVRLPSYTAPWTETKYIKRTMKKLGVDPKEYLESCGVTTIKKLVEMNPDTPAFFEVGLLLEWYDEK
jgi:hypothetical protein